LTENQRQKSDPNYAELLNRARIGIPTQEDINFLNSKIINPKEINSIAELIIQLEEKNAMYLCANNEIVDDINLKCIEWLNIKTFDIWAEDTNQGKIFKSKKNTEKRKKASETAGLEDLLQVGVNCKVMIRKNIDSEKGENVKTNIRRIINNPS
jgi:hypothetical protein